MKVIKKRFKLKVIFGILMMMMFIMNISPRILQNGSGQGYPDGDGAGDKSSVCNISIEAYVIQGAGYFLEANSCIQSILNRVELQDVNGIYYSELEQLVHRAFFNIMLARMTYEQLIQLAESLYYNQDFIIKLKEFKYESFMAKLELNGVVFDKLREYLEKGDITGTFKHTYSNLVDIEELLTAIKDDVSVDRLPELSLLWKLNEICAQASLFGSYAARVFHEIR